MRVARTDSRTTGAPTPRSAASETQAPDGPTVEGRRPADPSRIPWAELLMRVFGEDVLAFPCGGAAW